MEFEAKILDLIFHYGRSTDGESNILSRLAKIQDFYRLYRGPLIKLIEEELEADPTNTCPSLLRIMDEIINSHFQISQHFRLSEDELFSGFAPSYF